MPSLQDVESFKILLNELGDEPAILAERGERIEEVTPPEAIDLAGLLGTEAVPEEELDPGEESIPDEVDFDIDGIFPDETEPVPESEPEDRPEEDLAVDDDTFDMLDTAEDSEAADATAATDAEDLSEFAVSDDLADLNFELPDDEAPTDSDESSAGAIDDFSIPADFEFEDVEPDAGAELEAEPEPEPELGMTPEEDDFSIPEGLFDDGEDRDESDESAGDATDSGEDEFSIPEEFAFDDESDTFDMTVPETAEPAIDEFESADEEIAADESEIVGEELGAPSEDDFDLDDFSLGEIGDEFGLDQTDTAELLSEEELNPALAVSNELPGGEESLDLTDREFESLQETLHSLPRNLRLVVEELIGEQQIGGADLKKLVDSLVRGRSPKDIAAIASSITGEKIVIPSQYEKRTGLEFEEERGTFGYLFRHQVLPVLRVVAAGVAALALLFFISYQFIYRPIRATAYYRSGYRKIDVGSYLPANTDFTRGEELWIRRVWYYRYASAFRDRRRDDLAAEKYEELLERFPDDRTGLLAYADLETRVRSRYEHAEELLGRVIDREMYDYEARLLLGDTYTEWAIEDTTKHERARYQYALLLERFGNRDELMIRMLRFFIRTDNSEEVHRLTGYFQGLEDVTIDPAIYAELGGYLIDRRELDDVKPILFRAMAIDENIAEIHYHLARFFRELKDTDEEDRALINAYGLLSRDDTLTLAEERMLIDTVARRGEVAYRREQYLEAQSRFVDALDLYEDALDRRRLAPEAMFGRIYAALGDVFYYIAGQTSPALTNYLAAERNDYVTPDVRYKVGNIRYRNGEYDEALIKFYQAAGDYSANANLMYATANTLYRRANYSAAQGYYLHLLDLLETRRRNTPALRPEERAADRALLENLMRAYNNLGATLFRLSESTGEESKRSVALAYLTRSSEFFDRLTRDRETLVRTESKNLSYLNTRSILYPSLGFDIEIYPEIPRDMTEEAF